MRASRHRVRRIIVALVWLALPSGCSARAITALSDEPNCGAHVLAVVAHPDDDLLFMNPDVEDDITSSRCLTTVYLTAGDAGKDSTYWMARERGVEASYARMARVDDAWSSGEVVLSGAILHADTLVAAPNVKLVFVRLPDGIEGEGSTRYRGASLERLWHKLIDHVDAVDGSNRFNRQALIGLLADLIAAEHPEIVRTLDRSGAHGKDHSDHLSAARFAITASSALATDATMYRGYNISEEVPNLDAFASAEKWQTFLGYAAFDAELGGGSSSDVDSVYRPWGQRRYAISDREAVATPIISSTDLCFGAVSDEVPHGEATVLAACTDRARAKWVMTAQGELRNHRTCLDAGERSVPGVTPTLGACSDTDSQRWSLTADGHLRSGARCLAAPVGSVVPVLSDCTEDPAQHWRTGS